MCKYSWGQLWTREHFKFLLKERSAEAPVWRTYLSLNFNTWHLSQQSLVQVNSCCVSCVYVITCVSIAFPDFRRSSSASVLRISLAESHPLSWTRECFIVMMPMMAMQKAKMGANRSFKLPPYSHTLQTLWIQLYFKQTWKSAHLNASYCHIKLDLERFGGSALVIGVGFMVIQIKKKEW